MNSLEELFKTTFEDAFEGDREFNVADGLRMIGLGLHAIAEQLSKMRDVIESSGLGRR